MRAGPLKPLTLSIAVESQILLSQDGLWARLCLLKTVRRTLPNAFVVRSNLSVSDSMISQHKAPCSTRASLDWKMAERNNNFNEVPNPPVYLPSHGFPNGPQYAVSLPPRFTCLDLYLNRNDAFDDGVRPPARRRRRHFSNMKRLNA